MYGIIIIQLSISPELAVLLLGRNFNHSWLVNDARRSISLLHDADDPRLVSLLLLDVFAIRSSLKNTIICI